MLIILADLIFGGAVGRVERRVCFLRVCQGGEWESTVSWESPVCCIFSQQPGPAIYMNDLWFFVFFLGYFSAPVTGACPVTTEDVIIRVNVRTTTP